MWELEYKESWALKNWYFWTVMLEETLESHLHCKEILPVHPKGNQSWIFTGRTDTEGKTSLHWPPDAKNQLIGKYPFWVRLMEGGEGGYRGLNGWIASPIWWTWVWVSSGSCWCTEKLACCSPWDHKELDTTELTSTDLTFWRII